MIRKLSQIVFMIMLFSTAGCIKDTYDMNLLSKKLHLSPTMAISAIKGGVSLSDLVKSGDTVVFDQNNFVKIIFKEDSVIDLKLADFYDLNNMVSFTQEYALGDLSIDPFQGTVTQSLNQISTKLGEPYYTVFSSLNGITANFPAFPSINLDETPYSLFSNFENAVFRSGTLDISIKNNLTAPLNSITLTFFNTIGHIAIGSGITIPAILPGQTQTGSLDLSDKTVTNSITVAIVLSGSPGTTTPVLIDLNNSNIQVTARGRDLKVKSGRVILPAQTLTSLDNKDTVSFNPGSGIELNKLKITTGSLSYTLQSSINVKASLEIKLPTALRSGAPLSKTINVNSNTTIIDSIPADNTIIDMGADPLKPYNQVPMEYSIAIIPDASMVNFTSSDKIKFDLKFINPVFDYVKGYFGQQAETIEPDSLNLGIEDILSNLTGDFLISSPSIKINYSNSFAIPVQIALNATGKRKADTVNLRLAPISITNPVFPANRDVSSSFTIDKNNSSLPKLISMPPDEIRFSGSVKMNPLGNNGLRDNYVFGDSRILGAIEVEVPMEFRMNLQFNDTIDNFLADVFDTESDFNWDDFELFKIDFEIENGFPLGVSLEMVLLDSLSPHQPIDSAKASRLLEPATFDAEGKIVVALSSTSIEFTKGFFSSISKSDKINLIFTLITTEADKLKDIKIYSDYRIDFNAALVLKPDINLK
ncbi:MAG: hypothetical protein NT144_05460 [Bacteroidia bacterium]|nr:hypothetical protein [Bacteroidia bacterium]